MVDFSLHCELLTPFRAGWPANLHLTYSAFPVERDYEYSTIPTEPNIFISGLEILTFEMIRCY